MRGSIYTNLRLLNASRLCEYAEENTCFMAEYLCVYKSGSFCSKLCVCTYKYTIDAFSKCGDENHIEHNKQKMDEADRISRLIILLLWYCLANGFVFPVIWEIDEVSLKRTYGWIITVIKLFVCVLCMMCIWMYDERIFNRIRSIIYSLNGIIWADCLRFCVEWGIWLLF